MAWRSLGLTVAAVESVVSRVGSVQGLRTWRTL